MTRTEQIIEKLTEISDRLMDIAMNLDDVNHRLTQLGNAHEDLLRLAAERQQIKLEI